jgi:hypothetical protein
VVIIGSGKDGLPVILGNDNAPPAPPRAGIPTENDSANKQTAASPAAQ